MSNELIEFNQHIIISINILKFLLLFIINSSLVLSDNKQIFLKGLSIKQSIIFLLFNISLNNLSSVAKLLTNVEIESNFSLSIFISILSNNPSKISILIKAISSILYLSSFESYCTILFNISDIDCL